MANLIVDMDIPRACRWKEDGMTKRCPIAEWGGACAVTKLFEPSYDNRPSWCPIKGVLPDEHGDLIDRDEVKNEMLKRMPKLCMTARGDNCNPVVCTRQEILYPLSHANVVVAEERRGK